MNCSPTIRVRFSRIICRSVGRVQLHLCRRYRDAAERRLHSESQSHRRVSGRRARSDRPRPAEAPAYATRVATSRFSNGRTRTGTRTIRPPFCPPARRTAGQSEGRSRRADRATLDSSSCACTRYRPAQESSQPTRYGSTVFVERLPIACCITRTSSNVRRAAGGRNFRPINGQFQLSTEASPGLAFAKRTKRMRRAFSNSRSTTRRCEERKDSRSGTRGNNDNKPARASSACAVRSSMMSSVRWRSHVSLRS